MAPALWCSISFGGVLPSPLPVCALPLGCLVAFFERPVSGHPLGTPIHGYPGLDRFLETPKLLLKTLLAPQTPPYLAWGNDIFLSTHQG